MALDSFLLDALVCPENRTKVRPVEAKVVNAINKLIGDKKLMNRRGDLVAKKVEGALVREDDQVAYLVRDNIPIMLADESIQMADLTRALDS